MKELWGRFSELLFAHLPDSTHIYRFCRRYVDHYRGENNSDIRTNGELHFMRQRLPSCRTVFDVGANVGNWVTLTLDINPELEIHCFEPSHSTYQLFCTNPVASRVVHSNVALGAAVGEATLYVFYEGAGMNSMYRRIGLEDGFGVETQGRSEHVLVATLDQYCTEHRIDQIDYLKLDVEGYEMEVLKGAKHMLETGRIGLIQFEYGGCNIDARVLLKDFFAFFMQYGYTLYKIYPRRLQSVPRYDQRLEDFQYQNWVATRE